MAGLLDTDADFQKLKSRFGLVEQAREDVLPAIQNAENVTNVANDQLKNNMAVAQGQISGANQQTKTALDNLQRIETYPNFVSNVIGLFNPDWNKDVQGVKLNQAQHQVNTASGNLKMAEAGRNIAVQEALQRAETVEKFYTFTRQGMLDTQSMINMGFEVEKNIRLHDLNLAVDADIETLRMWSEDSSKAPKGLQDKPGLIGAELSRKVLAGQASAINQISLDKNSRNRWLNDVSDPAQLEAFAQNPASLPDYVKAQDVVNEQARRAKMGLNLQQLKVNIATDQFNLIENSKEAFLNDLNSFELQSTLSEMDRKGQRAFKFGPDENDPTFTRAEINNRLSASLEEETKTGLLLAETAVLEANLAETMTTMETVTDNMARLRSPGVENPTYDDLPPHIRTPVKAAIRRMNILSADGRLKSPGGLKVMLEEAEKTSAMIDKAREDLVTQYPEEEQPAVREFANTGAVAQPSVAANYLFSAGDNRSLGVFSRQFDPVFRAFSDELRTVKQAQTSSISVNEGQFTLVESKDPPSVTAVQQAITRSGAKQIAANIGVTFVLHNAFTDLIREAPKPGPQERGTPAPWEKIYDPLTGQFVAEAYVANEQGQPVLDTAKLNVVLARETLKLRESGALPAGLTLTDILFSKSLQYAQEYDRLFSLDITAAAFKTAAYGPGASPAQDAYASIKKMADTTRQALEVATSDLITEQEERDVIHTPFKQNPRRIDSLQHFLENQDGKP